MKTQSLKWSHISTGPDYNDPLPINRLNSILYRPGKYFMAAAPALGLVVGAAWAISAPGTTAVLQATVWATAFVFLALALDSTNRSFTAWSLATGLILSLIALMSAMVANEFLVLATVPIGAWLAKVIITR